MSNQTFAFEESNCEETIVRYAAIFFYYHIYNKKFIFLLFIFLLKFLFLFLLFLLLYFYYIYYHIFNS